MKKGDYIYEYNNSGQVIDRHVVWAVMRTHITLGTNMPNLPVRMKLKMPPKEDGSMKWMVYRRGKKLTRFMAPSPKAEADFLVWQLQEHIVEFVRRTRNIRLLQKIYYETREYTKAEIAKELNKINKENEYRGPTVVAGGDIETTEKKE